MTTNVPASWVGWCAQQSQFYWSFDGLTPSHGPSRWFRRIEIQRSSPSKHHLASTGSSGRINPEATTPVRDGKAFAINHAKDSQFHCTAMLSLRKVPDFVQPVRRLFPVFRPVAFDTGLHFDRRLARRQHGLFTP
ncbi:MAG: hypothetical protein AAGA28_10800 [Pseudomonadota bacterium]